MPKAVKNYVMRTAKGPSGLLYPYNKEIEEGFFSNYGKQAIQMEMKNDVPREVAYRNAFLYLGEDNSKMVWLEVGTGTGVLAQCALRAG